jgi:small conductance mechanosensitive channel
MVHLGVKSIGHRRYPCAAREVAVRIDEALEVVTTRGVALLVGILVLVVAYRVIVLAIDRVVPGLVKVQAVALSPDRAPSDELRKRVTTIQDLLTRTARVALWIGLLALLLAVLDLWQVLTGIGLLGAALVLASQSVVLDYVMGVLILIEGPFYRGDWIRVDVNGTAMEGEVHELGLRRTVLRTPDGALQAISNGLIRAASNLTRVYSLALAEVTILQSADLTRAIEIARSVAGGGARDADRPDPSLTEPEVWVMSMTPEGSVIRVVQRVPTADRWAGTSELRRGLAAAFSEAGIATTRWEAPLPVALSGGPAAPADGRQTPGTPAPRSRARGADS